MNMKYLHIIMILICALLTFQGCSDDLLQSADFSVFLDENNTYRAGDEVVFYFENAPDWVTFFSGEEGRIYPQGKGICIKSITEDLKKYSYKFETPGTYNVVFLGGNTNYKGNKVKEKNLNIIIKE